MARPATKREGMNRAAIRLFATHGLVGTTVKDIARESDATEGALYRHYTSKEDMAWQLYRREAGVCIDQLSEVRADDGGPLLARMSRAVRFIYGYYRRNPESLTFVLLARPSFPGKHLADEGVDPDRLIGSFLKGLARRGEIARGTSALQLAMVRGGVLQPLLMHWYGVLGSEPLRLSKQVAAAVVRVLDGDSAPDN